MRPSPRALAAVALAATLTCSFSVGPALAADPSTPATSTAASSGQVVVSASPGTATVPDLGTKAWVLADLDTGAILAMRDPDAPMRPASTLKLLTALAVVPRLSPDQPYRAVKADEKAEGNRVVLYAGMQYTVSDLLRAALLPSANDAADALGRANGGIDVTVQQMNAEAARLGAVHTVAKNPSGLDADGQLTTAYDMALIGRAAFENPEIVSDLALKEVSFPGRSESGKRITYSIWNHNQMLQQGYKGTLGGKSGYTSLAGRTYVGAAERDGRRFLVSLLDIGGNTYRTPERLLTWAFANADRLTPVGQLTEPSAPAPTFDRTVKPLAAAQPTTATTKTAAAQPRAKVAPDAPTSTEGASSLGVPGLPTPSLPSPLGVLTMLTWVMAVVVALRARVYWIAHRNRTAWVDLDVWARRQARSARRAAPASWQDVQEASSDEPPRPVQEDRAGNGRPDPVAPSLH